MSAPQAGGEPKGTSGFGGYGAASFPKQQAAGSGTSPSNPLSGIRG